MMSKLLKYKEKLVPHCFTQIYIADYIETF